MNMGMFAGAATLAAGAAYYMKKEEATTASCVVTNESYPPNGLSANVKTLPGWIQAGCGNDEYICPEKGSTYSCKEPLQDLPDLSEHNNLCADALKADLGVYDRLRDRKTSLGVNVAHCIKTGIDNKGHPMIKTCGIVAGDEESWTVFAEVMDKVIAARHNGYSPYALHPSDMNPANISSTKIDPTGNYILTARCRTGRSVRGFRLPPCNTFDERREIERLVVKGLLSMEGELKGDYFPLCGSRSYPAKPNGMSEAKEEQLRSRGNLFQEPDSTLLLSSGCGRHWPDARGIFHNDAMNFFVWINEEDHMRIISMEKGDDIKAIFVRFANSTRAIKDVLTANGYDFMHNEHLGFILTCPSNLGTGLRAGAMVKLPHLSARKDFKQICGRLQLQARGTAGVDSASTGGTWDISNADRLGKSETTLVNIFIEGVANYIRWETMLENGQSIEAELAIAEPGVHVTRSLGEMK
jgi:creatine kinase